MKKVLFFVLLFAVIYAVFVQFQIHWTKGRASQDKGREKENTTDLNKHQMYTFSFTKYGEQNEKEIEIEGASADITREKVDLVNVMAKAYAEDVPVTITSDKGRYDRTMNRIHLSGNVVATTEDGTRLLSESLDIDPKERVLETTEHAEVRKENINVEGEGAVGDSRIERVKFKKNVTVVVQDPDLQKEGGGPTIITADGPLIIDYAKNVAHFRDNVVAEDERGKLMADKMDVFYNKVSRRVSKIVAKGNVVIESPEGNRTYSDSVIYLADEGRVILGGDTEALYTGSYDENRWKKEALF